MWCVLFLCSEFVWQCFALYGILCCIKDNPSIHARRITYEWQIYTTVRCLGFLSYARLLLLSIIEISSTHVYALIVSLYSRRLSVCLCLFARVPVSMDAWMCSCVSMFVYCCTDAFALVYACLRLTGCVISL